MKKIRTLFLAAECIIYISFILLDMNQCFSRLSDGLKYSGILLCFLTGIFFFMSGKTTWNIPRNIPRNTPWKLAGLFCTVLADYFLLLNGKYPELGVFLFCLVQIFYFIQINSLNGKRFLVRVLAAVFLAFLLKWFVNVDLLIVLVLFYGVLSVGNVFRLMIDRKDVLFLAGLGLLFLCDICVGLTNLDQAVLLKPHWIGKIEQIVSAFIWIFYLPSQVCIVFSMLTKN